MLSKLKAPLEAKPIFPSVEVEVGHISLIRHQFDEINMANRNFYPKGKRVHPHSFSHSQMCREGFGRLLSVPLNILTLTIRVVMSAMILQGH